MLFCSQRDDHYIPRKAIKPPKRHQELEPFLKNGNCTPFSPKHTSSTGQTRRTPKQRSERVTCQCKPTCPAGKPRGQLTPPCPQEVRWVAVSRHTAQLSTGLTAVNHGQQVIGRTAGKHPDTQEPIGTRSLKASDHFFFLLFFFSVLKACDWPSHTRADPSQSQRFPNSREGCYPPTPLTHYTTRFPCLMH